MGLTTALNTSLNGLTLNETAIEVIGNNIANAGTNGFKASDVQFTTQLARTLSVGSNPKGLNGGTNPKQIGLGATTASIRRDFSQGAITTSTSNSDLAIEGEGFFVLDGPDGVVYSRNGNFTLNAENQLVNSSGLRVLGYGIDENFNIQDPSLEALTIPVGSLNVAQESKSVQIQGEIRTDEAAVEATLAEVIQTDPLVDTNGDPITGTTLLTDVRTSGSGPQIFIAGETLEFTPRKGDFDSDVQELAITTSTTVADLAAFQSATLGLVPAASPSGDPFGAAGVSVTTDGRIRIVSNPGSTQAVSITPAIFRQTQETLGETGTNSLDLGFTQVQEGLGEGTVVRFPVYDSLGEPVDVRMHAVLEEKTSATTVYRYFFESTDDSDLDVSLGTGTFVLNESGEITGDPTVNISIDRANTAAQTMDVEIDLSKISGLTEPDAVSRLTLLSQDGAPVGTLSSFNISDTGVISGIFTNGAVRSLGQVVLAQFANPLGLLEAGDATLKEGTASGSARITTPGLSGSGSIRAGAIELSNTDVGRSLVDLIVSSTNYRGNARVISSVQELVDELLILGR